MHTLKVPDLADGPVRIRHGGKPPFDLEAHDGLIKGVSDDQLPSVRQAFPEAVVVDDDGQYNPSAYSISDVNGYLDNADPEEVERVLALEATGKARKGILDGPHADPEA